LHRLQDSTESTHNVNNGQNKITSSIGNVLQERVDNIGRCNRWKRLRNTWLAFDEREERKEITVLNSILHIKLEKNRAQNNNIEIMYCKGISLAISSLSAWSWCQLLIVFFEYGTQLGSITPAMWYPYATCPWRYEDWVGNGVVLPQILLTPPRGVREYSTLEKELDVGWGI
jgi:hypothetical protein